MRARAWLAARLLDDRELLPPLRGQHTKRVGLHDTRLIHDLEPVGGEEPRADREVVGPGGDGLDRRVPRAGRLDHVVRESFKLGDLGPRLHVDPGPLSILDKGGGPEGDGRHVEVEASQSQVQRRVIARRGPVHRRGLARRARSVDKDFGRARRRQQARGEQGQKESCHGARGCTRAKRRRGWHEEEKRRAPPTRSPRPRPTGMLTENQEDLRFAQLLLL